jgi:fucose permease
VLLNRLVELLAVDRPAAALTRLHAAWGMGAVLIPLVVAGVLTLGLNWRAAGVLLLGLVALNVFMVLRWREFHVDHGPDVVLSGLPWRSIALFALMFILYVGVESAVGGWATTFFAQLGQGPILGAFVTSLFFLTFTIGRLTLAPATDRVGFGRSVQLGIGLGAVALVLTSSPQLALVGFALCGVAFSIVFPTMLAWSARRHPGVRAQMTSLAIAAAGVGSMVIPYLIGVGVDRWGPESLPVMLVGTTCVVLAASFLEPGQA